MIKELDKQGEYTSTLFIHMYMWYMCLYAKSATCLYIGDFVHLYIWLKSLELYDSI